VEIFSDWSSQGYIFEGSVSSVPPLEHVFVFAGRLHGPEVTATYTDFVGNTSELSAPLHVGYCSFIFLPLIRR
jgi:hypothetical protein